MQHRHFSEIIPSVGSAEVCRKALLCSNKTLGITHFLKSSSGGVLCVEDGYFNKLGWCRFVASFVVATINVALDQTVFLNAFWFLPTIVHFLVTGIGFSIMYIVERILLTKTCWEMCTPVKGETEIALYGRLSERNKELLTLRTLYGLFIGSTIGELVGNCVAVLFV